jgi:hypothetical protein
MNGILWHVQLSYLMLLNQLCLFIYYFIVYISTDIVPWLPFILMHSSTYFVNRQLTIDASLALKDNKSCNESQALWSL